MEPRDITCLSYDNIMEILALLPLKTIFKLKCVSKRWNLFVSQPYFQKQYRDSRGRRKHLSGFFFYAARNPRYPSMRDIICKYISNSSDSENLIQDKSFEYLNNLGLVIASSNGLLLLRASPTPYYVHDPLTKRHIKLPKTNRTHPGGPAIGFLCEVNDHDDEFSIYYKIVCVSEATNEVNTTRNMETYSSKMGKWKESLVSASSEFQFSTKVAKVIKDVFYWLDIGRRRVVVYDPNNIEGRMELIEFPSSLTNTELPYWKYDLCVARDGKVHFIGFLLNMEVWVLDDEKSGSGIDFIGASCWTLLDKINLANLGFDNITRTKAVLFNVLIDDEKIVFFSDGNVFVVDWRIKSQVRVATYDFVVGRGLMHYEQPIWPLLL